MAQGVWVAVALIPTLLVNQKSQRDLQPDILWIEYLGWTQWVVGFAVEVVADYQKAVFRNDEKNQGKFIRTGLWSVSRHPNYFGEILLWFGLYMAAFPSLRDLEHWSILSPVLNMFIIVGFSGLPPLETYAAKKWGKDPEYQKYKAKTPILVPKLW
ncbi:unnamed protein product [Darwinula stevensoni]|uniref:Steroid 5-alpha reductase C-terminal domain-containing protein n=1 Tax=Darwinula stevensoni TaxID=69355 RepID=A0A7R9A2S2_9CRUS|nr:unnamed protein product [Darwinula stevensoni]CAG0880083.1 unnamed protein product [Darwinula stevensoni]